MYYLEEAVRVSEKGQVVIPKRIRDKIGLETGDELTVNLVDQKIILRKRPKSYTDYMWGLHGDAWRGVDAGEYVEGERESWRRRG
ncbi:MAG: AbrB/MazE/SpoVT family DNA-binding domain-containing protein [Candidatus Bathyarchaeia archaeon]